MFERLIWFGLCMVIGAAVSAWAYEAGRRSLRRDIVAQWRQHACRLCAAEPRPTLIHVTGCTAGWPRPDGPEQFTLPDDLQ
jgi:hypothetical protein